MLTQLGDESGPASNTTRCAGMCPAPPIGGGGKQDITADLHELKLRNTCGATHAHDAGGVGGATCLGRALEGLGHVESPTNDHFSTGSIVGPRMPLIGIFNRRESSDEGDIGPGQSLLGARN